MQVINIKENEDGSANMQLDLTNEEVSFFLNYGIVQALKDGLAKGEECTVKEENDKQG